MNTQETAAILLLAQSEWPEVAITDDRIRAWSHLFRDHPYAAAEAALIEHMSISKWPPHASDLLERIAKATASGPPWEDAWAELIRTIKLYGPHIHADDGGFIPPYLHLETNEPMPGRPAWSGWSSPAVEAAVNHIGYEEARIVDAEALSILRAQFRDAYESARKRRIEEAQTGGQGALDRLRSPSGNQVVDPNIDRSDGPVPIGDVVRRMGAS